MNRFARAAAIVAATLVLPIGSAVTAPPALAGPVSTTVLVTPPVSGSVDTDDQVFFDKTFEITVDAAGLQLAGSEDGVSTWGVDDQIDITVTRPGGTTTKYSRNFEFQPLAEPEDLTKYTLPGRNTLRIVLHDTFGVSFGSTALWLRAGLTDTTPDLNYVALGDSFASGEGAEESQFNGTTFPDPKAKGSTVGCHRSKTSWANDVAAAIVGTQVRSWSFVACSGAVVDDLYGPNDTYAAVTSPEPAQIRFVGAKTYRATLSIGGNDANFAKILTNCVQHVRSPGGYGCKGKGKQARKLADTGLDKLRYGVDVPSLGPNRKLPLAQVYFDIANRMAPHGRLVVAGYPQMFAGSRWGYDLDGSGRFTCKLGTGAGLIEVRMDYRDAQWLNELAVLANTQIENSIADANRALIRARSTARVDYVSTDKQFDGHRLCSGSRWFNGVELTFQAPPKRKQVSLHPNAKGQQAYAGVVVPMVTKK